MAACALADEQSEIQISILVLWGSSPPSPKLKAATEPLDRDSREHQRVPVEVASKGMGQASIVLILEDVWHRLVRTQKNLRSLPKRSHFHFYQTKKGTHPKCFTEKTPVVLLVRFGFFFFGKNGGFSGKVWVRFWFKPGCFGKSPRREVVRSSAAPLFGGHSRSIPQGMILDVQPFVKSLFCPIRPSPNGFFDFEASTP